MYSANSGVSIDGVWAPLGAFVSSLSPSLFLTVMSSNTRQQPGADAVDGGDRSSVVPPATVSTLNLPLIASI